MFYPWSSLLLKHKGMNNLTLFIKIFQLLTQCFKSHFTRFEHEINNRSIMLLLSGLHFFIFIFRLSAIRLHREAHRSSILKKQISQFSGLRLVQITYFTLLLKPLHCTRENYKVLISLKTAPPNPSVLKMTHFSMHIRKHFPPKMPYS